MACLSKVSKIRTTGKSGSMTVTFTAKLSGENGVEVATKVAIKEPKPDAGASFFYLDADGNLVRQNPRQRDMFESVDGGAGRSTTTDLAS